jgi:uncharacterized membrane protein YfcA
LLFIYPHEEPEVLTSISLAVVFCNAFSGSAAYARKKRIDYRSGIAFALVSLPGSILGVLATHLISRRVFDPLFGVGLVSVGLYIILKKPATEGHVGSLNTHRRLVDADGHVHEYAFDMRIGLALSAVVGFVSSFLGIGGGIIHVPALVHLLGFPVHVATATSHFILAIMALTATVQHGFSGSLTPGLSRLLFLAPGVVIGAPLGARLSQKVRGTWILRALAAALVLVGLRLLIHN